LTRGWGEVGMPYKLERRGKPFKCSCAEEKFAGKFK